MKSLIRGNSKYYRSLINPNLANHNYFSNIMNLQYKNIMKIRTNVDDLHSETRSSTNLKTPWDERICKICDTKEDGDEHHFLQTCLPLIK